MTSCICSSLFVLGTGGTGGGATFSSSKRGGTGGRGRDRGTPLSTEGFLATAESVQVLTESGSGSRV